MYIKRATFTQVSGLSQQVRRVYSIRPEQRHLGMIEEILGRGERLSGKEDQLASAMGNVAQFSSHSEESEIVNGWEEERFRVSIEIVSIEPSAHTAGERTILTGFTDCINIVDDEIADDLEIYINGVIRLSDHYVDGPRSRMRSRIMSNNQLVLGRYGKSDNTYRVRPTDVFSLLSHLGDNEEKLDRNKKYPDIMFRHGVEMNARHNNISGRYISKLIETDYEARQEDQIMSGIYGGCRYGHAEGFSSESLLASDPVLHRLTTESEIVTSRYIEYGQLAIFTRSDNIGDVDKITEVNFIKNNKYEFSSDQLASAYRECIIAYTLSHAVPSIMGDSLLSSVKFTCDNESTSGRVEMRMLDAMHDLGDDLSGDEAGIESVFCNHFKRQVWPVISDENKDILNIYVEADERGEVYCKIEYNGGEEEVYTLPAYADANGIPTITTSYDAAIDCAESYFELLGDPIDDIIDDIEQRNSRVERAEKAERRRDRDDDRDDDCDDRFNY